MATKRSPTNSLTFGPVGRLEIRALTRDVEPFSAASYQKNTRVKNSKHTNSYNLNSNVGKTRFKELCRNGEIPVHLGKASGTKGWDLIWQVNIESLDFDWYIPIFMEGLLEIEHPYNYLANLGCLELMYAFRCEVVGILHKIMPILKRVLSCRIPEIVMSGLTVFKHLISLEPRIGPALIKYYPSVLPCLNTYYQKMENLDGEIWYGQRNEETMFDTLHQTFEMIQNSGGARAFSLLHKYVPCYQSIPTECS